MAANAFGIDLGTGNIKIYNNSDGTILNEKNMIAIQSKNILFAYGNSAFDMYEKAPDYINITYPVNNGVIADIGNMQTLLKSFLHYMCKNNIKPADYFIAVPTDITDVEKRAFYELIKDANLKARKIRTVEKAIADGLGMDIDVKNSQGVLVVDVGFDTTEISILSLGGIVLSKLIKIGGRKFDEAIKNMVRKEYNLVIGGKTAEKVKINLSQLEAEERGAVVYGRDIVTGLPVEREIPTEFVDKALKELINTIIDNIKVILERTPPELAADIYRQGIYLTGGSANTNHLDEMVSRGTGLRVNLAANASESVACGLGKVIGDDNYRTVAHDAALEN